jgi:NAD(P)-dependent dehydrogenase (short-subunit alcohol dehydrogenase family)
MPNPMNRVGRVDEITGLITFLASKRADYITGANFRVDGGFMSTTN